MNTSKIKLNKFAFLRGSKL